MTAFEKSAYRGSLLALLTGAVSQKTQTFNVKDATSGFTPGLGSRRNYNYDTLSFYGFFKQDKPHGATRAWVCRSISCALRGGEEVLDHMSLIWTKI